MSYGLYGLSPNGGSLVISGTANRAAIFDSAGELKASTVTDTELGYLSGVTSGVQAQLDAITTLADGKIYIGNGSNQITEVTISGDITVSNTGVAAISAGVIVNADINASAAIAMSKLAALTASRIVETDGSGVLSASSVTSSQLGYLSDCAARNTDTLADNQAAPVTVLSFPVSSVKHAVIHYSLVRGTSYSTGRLMLVNDGTNADRAWDEVVVGGAHGISFSVTVSGANMLLQYTSTNTGSNATFQHRQEKWV